MYFLRKIGSERVVKLYEYVILIYITNTMYCKGNLMKSFGIWYSNENTKAEKHEEELFKADLHINLWDIEEKYNHDAPPFIDIGLSIENFRAIDEICILIPFGVPWSEFEDLSEKLSDAVTASLVFNDNCTFVQNGASIRSLTLSENGEHKKLLYSLEKKDHESADDKKTIMKFNLMELRKDHVYDTFKDLYIRFRIRSQKMKEELFCDIKRKNQFLESGFTKTQVIDIKINKKRNISESDLKTMRMEKFDFLAFDKIHFLVMEPANHDVEIFGSDFIECRKLEEEWGKYLPLDSAIKDVLVYHWKKKRENGATMTEYAQMVKVTGAATSWKLIAVYVLAVIVMGIITNFLFTAFVQPWILLQGILR